MTTLDADHYVVFVSVRILRKSQSYPFIISPVKIICTEENLQADMVLQYTCTLLDFICLGMAKYDTNYYIQIPHFFFFLTSLMKGN